MRELSYKLFVYFCRTTMSAAQVSPKKRSPTKKGHLTASAAAEDAPWSELQARILLDNYDLEIATRKAAMRKRIPELLAALSRRCEAELTRLPASIHHLTVEEFVHTHGANIRNAVQAVTLAQEAEFQEKQVQVEAEQRADAVEKSVKKRFVV